MSLAELAKKWSYKLRRWWFPRPLKHLAIVNRHLQLRPAAVDSDAREIVWKGRVVGRLGCRAELSRSMRGDCFVVCTGPSLQNIDLTKIPDAPTIGVNGAILKFLADGVRPSHYTITDPDFFQYRFPLVRQVLEMGANCFFSFEGLSHICQRDPALLGGARIHLSELANRRWYQPRLSPVEFDQRALDDPDFQLHPQRRLQEDLVGFSRNLEKGLFCGLTIGYRAIQIAYHLGFERVFLLGMDLAGQGQQIRFYETAEECRPSLLQEHLEPYILPCFEILQGMCAAGELTVYNCSPGSRLPDSLVPKMSFESAVRVCRQSASLASPRGATCTSR